MPDSSLPFIHYSFLIPHSPRFRHQQRPPTVSYNKTDMEIIHKGPPCDAAKTTQQPASLNSGHELKLRGEKNRVIRLHVGRMLVFHFIKTKYIIIFFLNFHFVCLARIQNRGNLKKKKKTCPHFHVVHGTPCRTEPENRLVSSLATFRLFVNSKQTPEPVLCHFYWTESNERNQPPGEYTRDRWKEYTVSHANTLWFMWITSQTAIYEWMCESQGNGSQLVEHQTIQK